MVFDAYHAAMIMRGRPYRHGRAVGDFWSDIGTGITQTWNSITGQTGPKPYYNQQAAAALPPTPDTSQHILAVGVGSDNGGVIDTTASIVQKAIIAAIATVAPMVAAGYLVVDTTLRVAYKADTDAFVQEWQRRFGGPPSPAVLAQLKGTPPPTNTSLLSKLALGAGTGFILAGPAGAIGGAGVGLVLNSLAKPK